MALNGGSVNGFGGCVGGEKRAEGKSTQRSVVEGQAREPKKEKKCRLAGERKVQGRAKGRYAMLWICEKGKEYSVMRMQFGQGGPPKRRQNGINKRKEGKKDV